MYATKEDCILDVSKALRREGVCESVVLFIMLMMLLMTFDIRLRNTKTLEMSQGTKIAPRNLVR